VRLSDVWQKYKGYLISCGISLILGGIIVFAIGTWASGRQIERMSNQIAIGAETNKRLTEENKRLADLNNEIAGTVDELKARISNDGIRIAEFKRLIAERDRQYTTTISAIETAIRNATEGFGQANDDISGIIAVIEEVKILIESLP